MIIKIKRKRLKQAGFALVSTLIVVAAMLGVSITTENVFASNTTNQTVIARVNVSNTEPILYKVEITSPTQPIDLTPGGATVVTCNGSVQDINNFDDITSVNATFYQSTVASDTADDNNTHYSNSSCLVGGQTCSAIEGSNNQNGSCLCNFPVQYYANNGSWQCNMTVIDSGDLKSTENSSFVKVNEVLGIDVETLSLDYGNLSVSQISDPVRENVTNIGNIPINVTIRGYGGNNESIGQNVTMMCESGTNITFNNQRFDVNNNSQNVFADMINLTNQTRQIADLTIPKRTESAGFGNSSNSTFWRLQIPLGASGVCNGTIIFGAIAST